MKGDNERFRKANPVSITRIVSTLVDNLGIGTDIYLKKIVENWTNIVGTIIARNMNPVSLEDDILTIAVKSPSWNTQARFYKSSILDKIHQFEPDSDIAVRDIRFILER